MNAFNLKKIKKNTLGEKLKTRRIENSWSLRLVSQRINIPVRYLEYLENDNWKKLPGKIYIKNFLKKYTNELGLNFKLAYQQYQKEISSNFLKKKKINFNFKKIKNNFLNFVTPQKIKIFFIFLIILGFFCYLYFKINEYVKPPELLIISPVENISTEKNIMEISGKSEAEAILSINGQEIAVSENGDFSLDVKLRPGLNRFKIISQRKHSRQSVKEVIIYKNNK